MITKIDSITDFGIFKKFTWNASNDIVDFKEKNLIYGWNYSGKTTLSRIFSSIQKKELFQSYADGDFRISTNENKSFTKNNIEDFPYNILVFNSDYIKENLRWEIDDEINAIFFEVGDKAKMADKIEKLEGQIIAITGNESVKGEKEKFTEDLDNYIIFEQSLFTNESKRIKNEVFSSLIEFNKGHFKKQLPTVIKNIEGYILKKAEIDKLNKIVKIESPKPPVDMVEFDFNITQIINDVNEVLISEPNKKNVIHILDNNSQALAWVESGLGLHKAEQKCLFCDNPVTSERIDLLNKYYQNEAAKIRNLSTSIFEKIATEKEKLQSLNFPSSVQDLNEGYQDEYIKAKRIADKEIGLYLKVLTKVEEQLEKKVNNKIYEKTAQVEIYDTSTIRNQIDGINTILTENNEFSINFSEIIESERSKYIRHIVAKFLKENKYLSKQKKYAKALAAIESLDKNVDSFQKQIERLKAQKNSAEEGGQQFNYFIKSFLGKDDIEIKYNSKAQKYNLIRGKEVARHLSEGEKMAISFSHFLVTLKSLEQKDELKDIILFIDDPISSLDGNHIFQINALLKDFLYEKKENPANPRNKQWYQKCYQLFVSTHNYEFFNLLKEMPTTKGGFGYSINPAKGRESRYFINRKVLDSEIVKLPKVYDDFKSEYHYLFKQIHDFSEESPSEKVLLMPNVLRRFLEIYTLAKYPSTDEVDDRATEIWNSEISKRICKPFHFFSHFNNIDRIGKQSELLADVKQACLELIKQLKKDKTHYKALKATL